MGVGKTSFVNAMQYDKWKRKDRSGAKMLPSFETIETPRKMSILPISCYPFFPTLSTRLRKFTVASKIGRDKTLQKGKGVNCENFADPGYGFNFTALGVGVGGSKGNCPEPAINNRSTYGDAYN